MNFFSRTFVYSLISYAYLYFMSKNSPLGIDWRPFHQENIINATENIFNFTILTQHGLTTYLSPQDLERAFNFDRSYLVYVVQAQSYLHFAIAKIFGGEELVINLGQSLDKLAIILSAAITAKFTSSF